MLPGPPRLLLGVAFLFWGAMTGQEVAGLLGALALEARYWTKVRWAFGEVGFARGWHLSVIIFFVFLIVQLTSQDNRTDAALSVFTNLPLLLLPLMLVQQYALEPGMPVSSFSVLARRRMKKDLRAGQKVTLSPCHLGYPFLGILLASAGLDVRDLTQYGVGAAILCGWGFFHLGGGHRVWAWGVAFLLAMLMGGGATVGLFLAYQKMSKISQGEENLIAQQIQTSLGEVVDLKMSEDIKWRYQHLEGRPPKLLRSAVYNTFALDRWRARVKSSFRRPIDEERSVGGDFERLFETDEGLYQTHAFRKADLKKSPGAGYGVLRGQVGNDGLLPLPAQAARFPGLAAEGLEVNSLGSTQVDDPVLGSIKVQVELADDWHGDQDPSLRDLEVPEGEKIGLELFLEEAGVAFPKEHLARRGGLESDEPSNQEDLNREEKRKLAMTRKANLIEAQRAYFSSITSTQPAQEDVIWELKKLFYDRDKFTYTLKLRNYRGSDAIDQFLNEVRAGHCEYFASATALLLRRVGIPTRYAVGFSMGEKGEAPGEFVLRGTHAHAWCQAYLGGTWTLERSEVRSRDQVWRCRGGTWVNVDLTPPDWLAGAARTSGWKRKLSDWWQTVQEDVLIWFSQPLTGLILQIGGGFLGIGLTSWLVRRLWLTRRGRLSGEEQSWQERCGNERWLGASEKALARKVGPRPAGMAMGEYLDRAGAGDLAKSYYEKRFGAEQPPTRLDDLVRELRERLKGLPRWRKRRS